MKTRRLVNPAKCLWGILCLILLGTPVIAAAEIEHRTLEVNIGGSELVEIREPSQRMKILISNADIIGARPLRPNLVSIYNLGKKIGFSRVTVWDEAQRQVRAIIDVNVTLDLTPLKKKLFEIFPNEKIEVHSSETGVVLSGTVSGPEIAEQVLRLTQTFMPEKADAKTSGDGTGKSGPGITNLMKVGGIQQVMLEVKFAEVTRSSGRNWQAALGLVNQGQDLNIIGGVGGFNLGGADGITPEGFNAGSLLLNFAGLSGTTPANIFFRLDNFTSALRFLEDEGLARILAEPRLVTLSGQEASFLAGGEFPIPVPNEDGITIEFREFGVALRFTPVVMSDGRISLRVAPSVSDIVSTSSFPAAFAGQGGQILVPNLSTRKLETTVQMHDGQTLALAGLLQDNLRQTVSKVPGLGNLPIIGSLFRSTAYQQEKTDLLIAVTPHLVKPVREGSLRFPGEFMQTPNRWEYYMEGRLEGRRSPENVSAFQQHSFAAPAPGTGPMGGLEGEFGHEPVTVP